jgi:nitrous oxide reductase
LQESFVSNQSRRYKANGKDQKTQPKHAKHATPEQYKNVFTLEDKLKKIQECRKKERKKKVKFDVAKDEDILIEIDPACLVILDDHTITADD